MTGSARLWFGQGQSRVKINLLGLLLLFSGILLCLKKKLRGKWRDSWFELPLGWGSVVMPEKRKPKCNKLPL